MFLKKSLLLTKAAFIRSKYSKNSDLLLQFNIIVFYVNVL